MHALFALMAPAPGSTGSNGGMILLFQIAAIAAVFYFLILRPQSAARKKHQALLAGLKKGDEVMTAGGIIGKVRDIKENKDTNETRVTIESGTSTLVVDRSRIIRVGGEVSTAAPAGTLPG